MSDDRTAEHRAADDTLLAAISERLRVNDGLEADEVVEQYVIAAYVNGLDLQASNRSRYSYITRDSGYGPDAAPLHSLQGLALRLTDWLAEDDV